MFDALMGGFTPQEITAIALSLKVAFVATLCALPVGLCVALLLRVVSLPVRILLTSLVYLPLVMPPVVTGYVLLVLFGRHGAWGAGLSSCCSIIFAFRWTGAALAAAIMGFPLIVRALVLALDAIDQRLPQAALSLGASRLRVFATITLPLALPGIIAASILGFAKALGEFGATITFVSNIEGETQTIATLIYSLLQSPFGELRIWRLCLISLGLSLAALVVSEILLAKLYRTRGGA